MSQILPMTVPSCACCAEPTALLPRHDLPSGLAVCGTTGQLYRPEGERFVPTTMPDLPTNRREVEGVRIDLSRTGYA